MGYEKTTDNPGNESKTTSNKNRKNPTWTRIVLPGPVYYVFSPQDGTVLVGINVVVSRENNCYGISWWDPSHERCMTASKIAYNTDYFAFKRIDSEGGQLYFFIPMDLDIYNNRVKEFLVNGGDFENQEDMIKAFRDAAGDV